MLAGRWDGGGNQPKRIAEDGPGFEIGEVDSGALDAQKARPRHSVVVLRKRHDSASGAWRASRSRSEDVGGRELGSTARYDRPLRHCRGCGDSYANSRRCLAWLGRPQKRPTDVMRRPRRREYGLVQTAGMAEQVTGFSLEIQRKTHKSTARERE